MTTTTLDPRTCPLPLLRDAVRDARQEYARTVEALRSSNLGRYCEEVEERDAARDLLALLAYNLRKREA